MRHLQRLRTRLDLAGSGDQNKWAIVADVNLADPNNSACFRAHQAISFQQEAPSALFSADNTQSCPRKLVMQRDKPSYDRIEMADAKTVHQD
jgi:hypothetical protein